jgi:hypothetical protein
MEGAPRRRISSTILIPCSGGFYKKSEEAGIALAFDNAGVSPTFLFTDPKNRRRDAGGTNSAIQ